jgi:hypothetical protein
MIPEDDLDGWLFRTTGPTGAFPDFNEKSPMGDKRLDAPVGCCAHSIGPLAPLPPSCRQISSVITSIPSAPAVGSWCPTLRF